MVLPASSPKSWEREISAPNSINPGVVDTEGARVMDTYEQVATAIRAITPLGRTGVPKDIGLIVAFLASDEARWLTGEIIFGSGGLR